MRGTVSRFTIAATLAGSAAAAAAEPAPYPIEETQRPLLMPERALEGSAVLSVMQQDLDPDSYEMFTLAPRARLGLGRGEVEANASFFLGNTGDVTLVSETLQRLGLAGRYAIGDETAAGLELGLGNPTSDYSSYELAARLSTKRHLSPASALEVSAGPGITRGANDFQSVDVQAHVAAIAQLAPTASVQAHAQLSWYQMSATPSFPDPGWGLYQSYGLGALFSVAENLDVTASFDVLSTGQFAAKSISLGVIARRLP